MAKGVEVDDGRGSTEDSALWRISVNLQSAIKHFVGPIAVLAVAASLVAMPAASAVTVTTPAAPVLVSPADSRNTDTPEVKELVLVWTPVAGATSYEVQISPNEDWTNNTVSLPDEGKTVATRYAPPSTLPHASYFWRVRAAVGSTFTHWSADRTFTRDWSAAPATVSSPTASDPRFTWTPVQWASIYRLSVTASDGSIHTCVTSHTSYAPYDWTVLGKDPKPPVPAVDDDIGCFGISALMNGTTSWSVQAFDGTRQPNVVADLAPLDGCKQSPECSAVSDVRTFTYTAPTDNATLPVKPVGLATPACAAGICYDTPSMTWTTIPNATSYHVTVAVDPLHNNIQAEYTSAGAALTPRNSYFDDQAGRSYYWYVRACNSAGCGPVSDDAVFKKASRPAQLTSPADGAKLAGQVTFTWDDSFVTNAGAAPTVQEAMDYTLELASDSDFETNVQDFSNIDLAEFTNPAALLADGTYYWRVQPNDQSFNPLTWSAARSFSVDSKAPSFALSGTPLARSAVSLVASEPVNGVTGSTLGIRTVSSATPIAGSLVKTSSTHWTFTPTANWIAGEHYEAWVTSAVQDGVGNQVSSIGSAIRASTLVDSSSSMLTKHTGDKPWHTTTASDAIGKSFIHSKDTLSTTARSSVSTKVVGTKIYFDGCVSPKSGKAGVYVDGTLTAVVNMHRKSSGCREMWSSSTLANKLHTVTIVALGTKVTKSKGTVISVDAIRVR
jgi:Bacterial Ig-like domain